MWRASESGAILIYVSIIDDRIRNPGQSDSNLVLKTTICFIHNLLDSTIYTKNMTPNQLASTYLRSSSLSLSLSDSEASLAIPPSPQERPLDDDR